MGLAKLGCGSKPGCWVTVVVLTICPALHALDPKTSLKDYRVSEWQMTEGLPYPSVAALAQSADGYLWIGTRAGLGRFDGVSFTTYTSANLPQLTGSRITSFCEATDGTLWIGTNQGVLCYRNGSWSRPTREKPVDEGDVYSLFQESDGSMLVNCITKLYRLRDGRVTELALQDGAPVPRLNAIQRVSGGDVYLAGNGLVRETAGVLRDVAADAGMVKVYTNALAIDASDTLWLGTRQELIAWDGKQRRTFSARDGLPSNNMRSVLVDRDGNLWAGTTNGLARYGNGVFQQLFIHSVDSLSNVLCLYEDRERNLWVGTNNGLFRVQDVKVGNLTQHDGLPINAVLCVLEAKDGSRWAGTYGGGLAHLTSAGIKTFRTSDGLAEESVCALAEDHDGGLWMTYYSSRVSRFKNGKFIHYIPSDAGLRVYGPRVDAAGTVWVSDANGLYRFSGDKFQSVPFDRALAIATALHIDATGGIWLGNQSAVGRFQDGRWTVYPTSKLPPGHNLQCIFSDATGDIWILRDGPTVLRIHAGELKEFAFPVELGPLLYSGFAYHGDLWINFRSGVARIPLDEFAAVDAGRKASPAYVLYNEPDGMRSRAPNLTGSPGSAPMSDGSLWFSTSSGFAMIDPSRIRLNAVPPNVVIEHVFADKKEFALPDLARVPPGRGELAIHFTALSLVNPARIRFKYRLVGFDRDWSDADPRREANYGGLRPGSYRFEVIASNNEGVWNTTGAACEIVLLPHFYERWWFFAAIGLTLGGTGAGIVRWRSRHLQRRAANLQLQNTALERRIAERTAELQASFEALRASEYFYHSLVESLPQVIARKDAAGRYTYVNSAFGLLLGRPLDQIVGHTDEELQSPESAAKLRADDQRILLQRQPMEYEEILEREGGKRRYLHVKKLPLYDAQGQALGVQMLFWDMTVFRETEEKLKTAQKELVEISRLAGIAEVASGVLHNLGNALNSVNYSTANMAGTMAATSTMTTAMRSAKLAGLDTHAVYASTTMSVADRERIK